MKIAIITARGGSKRIPKKNIKNFCGKPIIAYSIQAAQRCGIFHEIMVSTDDEAIAEVALKFGAKVPFLRSKENSSDFATTAEVLSEVISQYQQRGINPTFVCGIYPTAPLISEENLQAALNLMERNPNIHSVNPIVRFSFPIQRAVRMDINHMISMCNGEHLLTRSQDLEPLYHDAGQFYWLRVKEFLKTPSLVTSHSAGLLLPEWKVQDIDNLDDWVIAELKFEILRKMEHKVAVL